MGGVTEEVCVRRWPGGNDYEGDLEGGTRLGDYPQKSGLGFGHHPIQVATSPKTDQEAEYPAPSAYRPPGGSPAG